MAGAIGRGLRAGLVCLAVAVVVVPAGIVATTRPELAAERAIRLQRAAGDLVAIQAGAREPGPAARAGVETAWSSLAGDARGTELTGALPGLRSAIDVWEAGPPGAGPGQARLDAAASALASRASSLAGRAEADALALADRQVLAGAAGAIGGAGALLLLGSVALWANRGCVRALARAANRLAGGLEPDIPCAGRRDAAGTIARALTTGRQAVATQRLIWQHSPVAMLVIGSDLALRQVNPAQIAMFRADPRSFSDREYMATVVASVTHPDDVEATARMYRRLLSGKSETERLEKRYIRPDGTVFWGRCILSLVRDSEGQPDHFVCLIEDISERRERLERAARVQRDLLPDTVPELDGYELAGVCRPTPEMRGDFYDWQRHGPGTLTLTLGDVTGRGMPAALLMAMVRTALRTGAGRGGPADAVRSLAASTGDELQRAGSFVRLFHGALELRTGLLRYVDAGNGLALTVGERGVRRLAGGRCPPVGLVDDATYPESSARLRPGEALVVASDEVLHVHPGLAGRPQGLGDLLAGARTAQEMADRLASGPGTPDDDVTVVVLRRAARPSRSSGEARVASG